MLLQSVIFCLRALPNHTGVVQVHDLLLGCCAMRGSASAGDRVRATGLAQEHARGAARAGQMMSMDYGAVSSAERSKDVFLFPTSVCQIE